MNSRRSTQSGVALVITLIMLSVITIIAVAFLALSQRERSSVSHTLTGTDTELMVNTGLDRARADITAHMISYIATNYTNLAFGSAIPVLPPNVRAYFGTNRGKIVALGPDLRVSRFDTNTLYGLVEYSDYLAGSRAPYINAISNLLEDPVPPVFVTNRFGTNFVSYLDLNRNGRFEPTGIVPFLDSRGAPGPDHYAVGDPQWIGVLTRPNEQHSGSNRFIGRYAFLIIPIGRTLDLDFIHNHAKNTRVDEDGFYRNHGYGSWELNLAAFLADLNTDLWHNTKGGFAYAYSTNLPIPSSGAAFEDAGALLRFRYDWPNKQLDNAQQVFGFNVGVNEFSWDSIDQYANEDFADNPLQPWPGALSPQRVFTIHDFYDRQKSPSYLSFVNRLADTNYLDSYNAHTLYRMLAQLGSDSAPEKMTALVTSNTLVNPNDLGRINLNYVNLNYDNTNEVQASDFIQWTPQEFFYTVADRLLRDHGFYINNDPRVPLSVTNLPVYPTNYYTPAVHRILQMTLNIFDSLTNKSVGSSDYPFYPTALKPIFDKQGPSNDVYIVGYEEMKQDLASTTSGPGPWGLFDVRNWRDLSNATDRASLRATDYVYGVPILIGAKKGYPSFNEFVLDTVAQVERKLQVQRTSASTARTNQMFIIGVSNAIALEAWNSYSTPFPRPLTMFAGVELSTSLTNSDRIAPVGTTFVASVTRTIPPGTWGGGEFLTPLPPTSTNLLWLHDPVVPYSLFRENAPYLGFTPTNLFTAANPMPWEVGRFPAPQWVVTTTNRVRFFLIDNGHLVDAVGLAPSVTTMNITAELDQDPVTTVWRTNRINGAFNQLTAITEGIQQQLIISQFGSPQWSQIGVWADPNRLKLEAEGFRAFLDGIRFRTNTVTNTMNAPFTPQRKISQRVVYEVNDPFVHHIVEDLRFDTNTPVRLTTVRDFNFTDLNILQTNEAYKPWGGPANKTPAPEDFDMAIRDPNVRSSNDWDFPTNKFGNLGWLGRVHRGTPWQTIYFKPTPPTQNVWRKNHQGGWRSSPTNDWRLADIFTVAQHPNASRGTLSVNQTNVPAWSALLSGVRVGTSFTGNARTNTIIEPMAVEPHLNTLVEAINKRREALPGKVFASLAEFLAGPELTTNSPYLTPPYAAADNLNPERSVLRDEDYEAIPQNILSLVKVGEPRFLIYAFGQSLKPAPASVIPGGINRGLCLNYEVTGELAARAIVRMKIEPRPNGPPRVRSEIESFNFIPPD